MRPWGSLCNKTAPITYNTWRKLSVSIPIRHNGSCSAIQADLDSSRHKTIAKETEVGQTTKIMQTAESLLRSQMKDAIKETDSSQRSSLHRKFKVKCDTFIVKI